MRALITGGGFVAGHLARALTKRGDEVVVGGLQAVDGVAAVRMDVRSQADVDAALDATLPDAVFHLAGVSFPPEADRAPDVAYDVNAVGVVRLLNAILRGRDAGAPDPVVVVVGTAVQYGRHDEADMPLDEGAEQRPASVYGASKAAQEIAALQFARRFGVRVVCTRSFNHSGTGHGAQYLLPSLVRRVKALSGNDAATLALGNDVVRDYLHVDDVVGAYLLLAERGRAGEVYNVASGQGVSTRQLAADVLLRAGVSAEISTEPALVRASDIPTLIGSPAKLVRDTGWRPAKTYADIIDDLLHAEAD